MIQRGLQKYHMRVARLSLLIGAVLFIAGLMSVHGSYAQTIPYTKFKFERNSFADLREPANALDLVPVHGGSTGKVWFLETDEGILVLGKVNVNRPRWARFPMEFRTAQYVDVWLAASKDVEMPEIAWGNQFGYTNCKYYNPKTVPPGAEDCAVWSARQVSYRDQLRRLFVREWRLAPNVSTEVFASTAYGEVLAYANDGDRLMLSKLHPSGNAYLLESDSSGFFYFQAFMRWSDFPPAPTLELARIYLAVEVHDGDAEYSSTAPARKGGEPATFNQFDLARPFVSHVSACEYPLTGFDSYDHEQSAWYIPSADGHPQDTFILANDVTGYQYSPAGLSPIPFWSHHFSKNLGNGNIVCGPNLKYVSGEKDYGSKYFIDEHHFSTHKLPGGSYLLRSGPVWESYSRFGSGQGGSDPTARVSIFHLIPADGIEEVLSEELRLDYSETVDGDIQFSPDWKIVTVYRATTEDPNSKAVWTSNRYCWLANTYKDCESGSPGPPPKPRQLVRPRWAQ